MAQIRLGRIALRWCDGCNVPVLESKVCGRCGASTRAMEITPPGDARPAFSHDIELARRTLDAQFGEGVGAAVLPDGHVTVLNKAPALDRMDEIIADGAVLGTMRYDVGRGWTFIPRMQAARAMEGVASRGRVVADDGAIPFILKGSNLLAPGVVDADPGIKPGDEIVILDRQGKAIAAGRSRMSTEEMSARGRGMAVKVRWAGEEVLPTTPRKATWEEVIEANRTEIERKVSEAVRFIQRVVKEHDLPAMVSFSGGKDSLATLLLVKKAGLDIPIFFIDTGLEFPETVQHVKDVAARHGARLIVEQAPREAFQEGLRVFGPPGRDYRWCCKTNKLGPTVRAVMKHYPEGVLSFIGQRRYESEARASKPRVWNNPWTPGQVGASPIQNWTSLHVWVLIMSEGEDANPWYERGLDRIGCFLCPASDLAELELVKEGSPLYGDWLEALRSYARSKGLPDEWAEHGAWRWRKIPQSYRQELESAGIAIERIDDKAAEPTALRLALAKGVSPCTMGFSIEGAFSRSLDLERVANVLNIIGPVELNVEEGWCAVEHVTLFEEGALVAKDPDPEALKEKVERIRRAVVKAEECVGCGVCVARCCEGALRIELGKIVIDDSVCIHCGRCAEPCPAVTFGDSAFDF
ncbi:MAG TPA: phosphoadenosine phosphosulfate reductase family protein [Methanomassiliicoccaceae archaeon]|nr:phosphoadenosine phosphosulfate reductase family protein [Methanomassiliicoccaceae archaeon]